MGEGRGAEWVGGINGGGISLNYRDVGGSLGIEKGLDLIIEGDGDGKGGGPKVVDAVENISSKGQ